MVDENVPFACLTCYDATTARWLERAGVPILLVGDTAAEVILGFKRTLDMPLDVLIALTAAVKRGAPRTLVMGDMPFLSYHISEGDAIRNAGRFVVEGMADIVSASRPWPAPAFRSAVMSAVVRSRLRSQADTSPRGAPCANWKRSLTTRFRSSRPGA